VNGIDGYRQRDPRRKRQSEPDMPSDHLSGFLQPSPPIKPTNENHCRFQQSFALVSKSFTLLQKKRLALACRAIPGAFLKLSFFPGAHEYRLSDGKREYRCCILRHFSNAHDPRTGGRGRSQRVGKGEGEAEAEQAICNGGPPQPLCAASQERCSSR